MALPHAASVTPARPAYTLSRGAITAGIAAATAFASSLLVQGTGSGFGLSLVTPSAYSAIASATFGALRY